MVTERPEVLYIYSGRIALYHSWYSYLSYFTGCLLEIAFDTDIAYRITVIESNLQASQVLKTCDYSCLTQNLTSYSSCSLIYYICFELAVIFQVV